MLNFKKKYYLFLLPKVDNVFDIYHVKNIILLFLIFMLIECPWHLSKGWIIFISLY
jgi:hypothetical protein